MILHVTLRSLRISQHVLVQGYCWFAPGSNKMLLSSSCIITLYFSCFSHLNMLQSLFVGLHFFYYWSALRFYIQSWKTKVLSNYSVLNMLLRDSEKYWMHLMSWYLSGSATIESNMNLQDFIFCCSSFIKFSYDHKAVWAFFYSSFFVLRWLLAGFSSFRNHCTLFAKRSTRAPCALWNNGVLLSVLWLCVLLNEKRSLRSISRLGFLPNAQKGALLRRLEKIKAVSALDVYKHKPNKHWTFYLAD